METEKMLNTFYSSFLTVLKVIIFHIFVKISGMLADRNAFTE
jgi:hypothetical protein